MNGLPHQKFPTGTDIAVRTSKDVEAVTHGQDPTQQDTRSEDPEEASDEQLC